MFVGMVVVIFGLGLLWFFVYRWLCFWVFCFLLLGGSLWDFCSVQIVSCHLTLRLSVQHRSGQAAGEGTAFSVLLLLEMLRFFDLFRLV